MLFLQKLISPLGVLLFVALFTLAYFYFAHEGFYWIDDYGYARYAWEVLNGTFSVLQNTPTHPNNPLTHRLMIFGPVAVFYRLFGLNIYTATFWPLLCTLASSGLIYLLFRRYNPMVAVTGIILLGLYFHSLFLASYLYPDNILMFMAFAATAALFRYRYQKPGSQPALFAGLFVLFNFLSLLSKETISYYVLFYLYLFLLDLFQGKHRPFWGWALGFGAVVLAGYFGWYHFRAGEAFYRFRIIEYTNEMYLEDMQTLDFKSLLKRLTFAPWLFFIGSGIMVPLIFALGLFYKINLKDFLKLHRPEYFWLLLALLVLLQFWFGSTSTRHYIPITLLPRMCTVLMPPLCLAAAFGLQRYFSGNRFLALAFALLFSLAGLVERSNMLVMYVPLALYFAWNYWKLRNPNFRIAYGLGILALVGVLVLRPLHFMRKPALMSFQDEHKLVKTYLDRKTGRNLVIGDRWQNFMYDFHYKFEPNPHYTYKQFNQAGTALEQYDRVYLLVNRSNLSNPDMAKWQTVQEPEINELFPEKELIAQEGNVLLYQVKP